MKKWSSILSIALLLIFLLTSCGTIEQESSREVSESSKLESAPVSNTESSTSSLEDDFLQMDNPQIQDVQKSGEKEFQITCKDGEKILSEVKAVRGGTDDIIIRYSPFTDKSFSFEAILHADLSVALDFARHEYLLDDGAETEYLSYTDKVTGKYGLLRKDYSSFLSPEFDLISFFYEGTIEVYREHKFIYDKAVSDIKPAYLLWSKEIYDESGNLLYQSELLMDRIVNYNYQFDIDVHQSRLIETGNEDNPFEITKSYKIEFPNEVKYTTVDFSGFEYFLPSQSEKKDTFPEGSIFKVVDMDAQKFEYLYIDGNES